MEEEEEEDKSENPVDLTIDSIQWILSQNVRAGTLAMFWCLKSQVFKVKARVFHRWHQHSLLSHFLNETTSSTLQHRRTPISQHLMNGVEPSHQLYSPHRDHTEHIVSNTIVRSENKLMLSLKRDYLRYEKDRSSSHSKINVSPPASMWSLEAVKSTPKNIPSYMRGTIAASSKYSMNDVHDHQVVRSITRATSPSKEHSMSHSKEHSMGHSKEHSMRLGGGNMKSQVSTMNTLDAPHSAFHAHSVPATASTRTVSSTPIYQFPPHQVPPQPMSSISTIAPNQSTINSANRYNNHTIQSYDSMEASTPYHLLQPVGGMTTTPSSTDSKEKLLFILNTKFKAIAEKGLLDEATISSVMRNNEKAVEKYLQSSTSSMNTSIRSSMQPSVQPSIQPSVRTSSTNGMTKYGIVKQSPDESDFRQPVQQIEPHQLFISPAPARNRSIATENAVPVTLAPPVHQSEVVSHKIAGKSMNGMGKHPSSVVMDKEERGRSIAPSVQVYPSRRGRSEDQRSVNTAGGRLYRKKAWKVGSSMSPSKRDTSPPILLDKAHFKLLQSERGRDVNRSWSASLRG